VQWLGYLLPPVSDLLQGFMCVCTQVSGSVVSNWPLCEFCGRADCDIWYIFLIPQFLRHQTMDKVQKYNSFNTNTPSSESYRNYSLDWLTKLHLVAESCTICSSHSRRPVWKLLDAPLYLSSSIFLEVSLCFEVNFTMKQHQSDINVYIQHLWYH
jgi:hypothetical protein